MKLRVALRKSSAILCRVTLCAFLIVSAMLGLSLMARSAHATTEGGVCQSYDVPVALSAGQPLQFAIYGELCNPKTGASRTLELTIPGATYDHTYWDFPYQPQTYSYVLAANAAGYSTFNIDRIGTGLSSHPDLSVVTVTMDIEAYILHEIVQDLRSGSIGSRQFARVLLVGHSLGSGVVWIEAGTYRDVDGVIVSGLAHHFNAVKLAGVFGTLYPAMFDPRFSGDGYGAEYVTTEPGTRASDFYYQPGADPEVIATDEATKETAADGEAVTFGSVEADAISAQITVPVLLVLGQQDSIFCGQLATNCSSASTVWQAEAPYYSPQAQLQVAVIPNVGHDLNLHESAPLWFKDAIAWAYQYVAP